MKRQKIWFVKSVSYYKSINYRHMEMCSTSTEVYGILGIFCDFKENRCHRCGKVILFAFTVSLLGPASDRSGGKFSLRFLLSANDIVAFNNRRHAHAVSFIFFARLDAHDLSGSFHQHLGAVRGLTR